MPESAPEIIQHARFFETVDSLIDESRNQNSEFAVLLIGIDKFRQINLFHGFETGNEVLSEIFRRLQQVARKQDLVVRTGSAEFVFFIRNLFNEGHVSLAAVKILQQFEEAVCVENRHLKINASIGGSIFPDHGQNSLDLLRSTESALLEARQRLESYYICSGDSDASVVPVWNIESELAAAIDRDEFELHFQPQIDLDSGRVTGAEALLCWNHPGRGLVQADFFTPIAERSKLIYEISNWAIRSALWLGKEWPLAEQFLNVSVDLSPRMFEYDDLVDLIKDTGSIFGVDLARLTLEVTESALGDQTAATAQRLDKLKQLGVKLSIDDFGTGNSSMSYFKTVPANELKIDRSFVANILENPMDLHIVRTIIDMAHGFGLRVVADGVESLEIFERLSSLGCDVGQGNYICAALPQNEFIDWLNQYNSAIERVSNPAVAVTGGSAGG